MVVVVVRGASETATGVVVVGGARVVVTKLPGCERVDVMPSRMVVVVVMTGPSFPSLLLLLLPLMFMFSIMSACGLCGGGGGVWLASVLMAGGASF